MTMTNDIKRNIKINKTLCSVGDAKGFMDDTSQHLHLLYVLCHVSGSVKQPLQSEQSIYLYVETRMNRMSTL